MTPQSPSALISGASIAGPALADLLVRQGWSVTVVERAPELRGGGQNVDVEGEGREVAEWMGLLEAIRAAGTGERGTELVDSWGASVALFPAGDDASFTAELEVPRGALSAMLYERSRPGADYRFGETIAQIDQTEQRPRVRFSSGAEESYDLVIVAEGLRSATRDQLFPDARLRHLGLSIAWFAVPRRPDDSDTWRIYHAPGGRVVSLRPAREVMRVMLALRQAPSNTDRPARTEQVALLRERFADAGWQAERVLDGLDGGDLEFQPVAQVHAPAWSTGRVVLLGDAAYCPSPFTGQGTSLALIGAYLLAGELADGRGDIPGALARYEQLMRPRVEAAQKLPPASARIALPESRLGVATLRTLARLAASGPVSSLRQRIPERTATSGTSALPAYPALDDAFGQEFR